LYLATKRDDESKMNSIADLIAEGDRIQMSDKALEENWLHGFIQTGTIARMGYQDTRLDTVT
jgi:hypothetical protein